MSSLDADHELCPQCGETYSVLEAHACFQPQLVVDTQKVALRQQVSDLRAQLHLATISEATAEAEANDLRADRGNLREFLGALIEMHLWQRGAFEHFTGEDIWHHAVRCGLVVPDLHPQPCPIEECECGDYSGQMWRLAWMPATGTQQEVKDD